jgi:hypothetical protein
MDPDLEELLRAWMGTPLSEARQGELLSRLRSDTDLQAAFVEEIQMHGMLKAAQSPEPRWLSLNEELGIEAGAENLEEAFTAALEQRIIRPAVFHKRLRRWAFASAAALLLLGSGFWFFRPTPGPSPSLAVLARLSADSKATINGRRVREGDVVAAGRLRLAEGSAALSFFNGAILFLEGESDVDLLSMDRVACRLGRVRLRAEGPATGFTLTAPGAAVVDLGTEFALNVGRDGKSAVHVFEGQVEASLLNRSGSTLSSDLLNENQSARMEPGRPELDRRPQKPEDFARATPLRAGGLRMDTAYARSILEAKPWAYWRFQTIEQNRVLNEVASRPALQVHGEGALCEEDAGNRSLEFPPGTGAAYALMEGVWQPPTQTGYAIELWMTSAALRTSALLCAVEPRLMEDFPWQELREKHVLLLQLMDRSQQWIHPHGSLRLLQRVPAGFGGGINAFSDLSYTPGHWHHIVAQNTGKNLQLWIDGKLAGVAAMPPMQPANPCEILLGRLSRSEKLSDARPFRGRIDEVALYERALSPGEIARHHALGSVAGNGLP